MLRGMNCERFIENFAEAKVNLYDFLTIDDERLKEIGISFKFERNIVMMGLHNFHNEPWSQKALFLPVNFDEDLSDLNLMTMLANVLRQLVVVKAQFVYMERLGKEFDIKDAYKHLTTEFIENFRVNVERLKKLMGKKKKMVQPLLIRKQKSVISNIGKIAVIGLLPMVAFAAFKFIKK